MKPPLSRRLFRRRRDALRFPALSLLAAVLAAVCLLTAFPAHAGLPGPYPPDPPAIPTPPPDSNFD